MDNVQIMQDVAMRHHHPFGQCRSPGGVLKEGECAPFAVGVLPTMFRALVQLVGRDPLNPLMTESVSEGWGPSRQDDP